MHDGPLVITESVLASILTNPAYLEAFPFVKNAAEQLRGITGCGKCQKSLSGKRTAIMGTLKSGLVSVSGDQLLKLKSLLGYRQLRISLSRGGQVHTITF